MVTIEINPDTRGLPKDEIGWKASEEYASRLNTPMTGSFHKPLLSNHSQPHVESPLRKASFPVDDDPNHGLERHMSHLSSHLDAENALESETEDDDVAMITRKTDDLELQGDGINEEHANEVPILAADEVARTPGAEYLQPAVSPAQERKGSNYYSGYDAEIQGENRGGSRSGSASNSRPTSRPGSVYSNPGLSRFTTHDDERENMHTPLEDVDEYEPLFPDEEGSKERRPVTAADRLKLREQMKRFPSKDIWEDSPDSAQLQASVETPEPTVEQSDPMLKAAATTFETPEQEAARKGEVSEDEKAKLIPKEERLAKSQFKPHIRNEMSRPGLAQRFPSRDIWEDSPDSSRLETTVGAMPTTDPKSPTDAGLEAGAVVQTSGAPSLGVMSGVQTRDNATVGAVAAIPTIPPRPSKDKATPEQFDTQPPSVPARPPKRLHQVPPADAQVPIPPSKEIDTSLNVTKQPSPTESRKGPTLPDRQKPQVPARPTRPVARESSETVPLSKITSASSAGGDGSRERDPISPPAVAKPKPAVPARPVGSKIASLKAGFLSDLDSRLKVGPQGPNPQEKAPPEIEEEKAPLADARKSRAKGPSRRKPVAPAVANTTAETEESKNLGRNWQIQEPRTIWEHDGAVRLGDRAYNTVKGGTTIPNDPLSSQAGMPASQVDGAEDAKDKEQAKAAVDESLAANDPLSERKNDTPDAVDLPSPTAEITNPLSKAPSGEPTPGATSPATVTSPIETHIQRETGEKTTVADPVSEIKEEAHAVSSGETQKAAEDDDATVP